MYEGAHSNKESQLEDELTQDEVVDALIDMMALVKERGWVVNTDGMVRTAKPTNESGACACPLVELARELGFIPANSSLSVAWPLAWPPGWGDVHTELRHIANAADYRGYPLRPSLLEALGLTEPAA